MPDQVLYPAAIEEIDNLTGTVGQLSDENNFITADDGSSNTEIRVSFPTPDGDLDGAQTVNIRVRRTDNSNREPELTVELYEDGTSVDTLLEDEEVDSPDGEWFNLTFDAGQIGDPSQVEIHCSASRTGGAVNDRNTVEFDVIEWEASLAEEQEEHDFSAGDTALAISAGGQLTPSVAVATGDTATAIGAAGDLTPAVDVAQGDTAVQIDAQGVVTPSATLAAGDRVTDTNADGAIAPAVDLAQGNTATLVSAAGQFTTADVERHDFAQGDVAAAINAEGALALDVGLGRGDTAATIQAQGSVAHATGLSAGDQAVQVQAQGRITPSVAFGVGDRAVDVTAAGSVISTEAAAFAAGGLVTDIASAGKYAASLEFASGGFVTSITSNGSIEVDAEPPELRNIIVRLEQFTSKSDIDPQNAVKLDLVPAPAVRKRYEPDNANIKTLVGVAEKTDAEPTNTNKRIIEPSNTNKNSLTVSNARR